MNISLHKIEKEVCKRFPKIEMDKERQIFIDAVFWCLGELRQGAVISTCQHEPKTCDCKRKDDYTAKFICDGNCK